MTDHIYWWCWSNIKHTTPKCPSLNRANTIEQVPDDMLDKLDTCMRCAE